MANLVPLYGQCPVCGAPCETRERRPNGNDRCTNGHEYPSAKAVFQDGQKREFKTVDVALARRIAADCNKDIVVIFCIDRVHDKSHFTTFGVRAQDKIDAAKYGELIAEGLGCGGPMRTFEDFRSVDAANNAERVTALEKALEGVLAVSLLPRDVSGMNMIEEARTLLAAKKQ